MLKFTVLAYSVSYISTKGDHGQDTARSCAIACGTQHLFPHTKNLRIIQILKIIVEHVGQICRDGLNTKTYFIYKKISTVDNYWYTYNMHGVICNIEGIICGPQHMQACLQVTILSHNNPHVNIMVGHRKGMLTNCVSGYNYIDSIRVESCVFIQCTFECIFSIDGVLYILLYNLIQ